MLPTSTYTYVVGHMSIPVHTSTYDLYIGPVHMTSSAVYLSIFLKIMFIALGVNNIFQSMIIYMQYNTLLYTLSALAAQSAMKGV